MYQGSDESAPQTASGSGGDLQAANRAASAFNGFASLINEIVGNLQGPLPSEEGMPTPSPFSYDSSNQQDHSGMDMDATEEAEDSD